MTEVYYETGTHFGHFHSLHMCQFAICTVKWQSTIEKSPHSPKNIILKYYLVSEKMLQ